MSGRPSLSNDRTSLSSVTSAASTSSNTVIHLEGGWKECRDDETCDSYFYNDQGDVRWEKPTEAGEKAQVKVRETDDILHDDILHDDVLHDDIHVLHDDDLRAGVVAVPSLSLPRAPADLARTRTVSYELREQMLELTPPPAPPKTPKQRMRMEERLEVKERAERAEKSDLLSQQPDLLSQQPDLLALNVSINSSLDSSSDEIPLQYLSSKFDSLCVDWAEFKLESDYKAAEQDRVRKRDQQLAMGAARAESVKARAESAKLQEEEAKREKEEKVRKAREALARQKQGLLAQQRERAAKEVAAKEAGAKEERERKEREREGKERERERRGKLLAQKKAREAREAKEAKEAKEKEVLEVMKGGVGDLTPTAQVPTAAAKLRKTSKSIIAAAKENKGSAGGAAKGGAVAAVKVVTVAAVKVDKVNPFAHLF